MSVLVLLCVFLWCCHCIYSTVGCKFSGLSSLKPPFQSEKYGFKMEGYLYWIYRWKLTLTPANIGQNIELSTRLYGSSSENWGFGGVITWLPVIIWVTRVTYDNWESRDETDDDAETSVFWRRPVESGRKQKISPNVRWCQCELPSIWIIPSRLNYLSYWVYVSVRMMLLMDCLKMKGILTWRGLK